MSRTISNSGLARLCASKEYQLADVAYACSTRRETIYRYAAGRKAYPLLESSLASLFALTVPQLRLELGLPSQPNPNGGPHAQDTDHPPRGPRRDRRK